MITFLFPERYIYFLSINLGTSIPNERYFPSGVLYLTFTVSFLVKSSDVSVISTLSTAKGKYSDDENPDTTFIRSFLLCLILYCSSKLDRWDSLTLSSKSGISTSNISGSFKASTVSISAMSCSVVISFSRFLDRVFRFLSPIFLLSTY